MSNQKSVFWQALILSVLVFSVGVTLGFFLESSRADKIGELYSIAETEFLDVRLQSEIYDNSIINCDTAVEENINFGDRIYQEARTLDKYEEAQRISDSLIQQHKKYDLLRLSFLINSIKIKNYCKAGYDTILYLYKYSQPTIEEKARQRVISQMLSEIKEEKGSELLLIPIAGDLDLGSIEVMKNNYGARDLPTIIINGKDFGSDITKEEIINLL